MTGARPMAESDTTDTRSTSPTSPGAPDVRAGTTGAVEVALLDRSGLIVAVNGAWMAFGTANGADPDRIGVGVSYLDICAAAPGDPYARDVASALRTALGGDLPAPVQVAVPCHGPDTRRWFDVLISSRFDDSGRCVGATVTLSPVVATPEGLTGGGDLPPPAHGPTVPAYYDERSERLGDVFAQLLFDRAPLGILVVDDQGWVVRAGRAAGRLFGYGTDGLAGRPLADVLPGLDPFDPVHVGGTPVVGTARPALLVEGVLASGSTTPVEVHVGHVPLTRGTGAVLLVREACRGAAEHPPDHVVFLEHEIDDLARDLDEVVRHVFASGLTVTGAAAAHPADRALAATLEDVTEGLDRAVRELRTVAFRLQQQGRRTPLLGPPGPVDTAS